MSMSGILGNEQNKSNGVFLRTLKFRQRVKRKITYFRRSRVTGLKVFGRFVVEFVPRND